MPHCNLNVPLFHEVAGQAAGRNDVLPDLEDKGSNSASSSRSPSVSGTESSQKTTPVLSRRSSKDEQAYYPGVIHDRSEQGQSMLYNLCQLSMLSTQSHFFHGYYPRLTTKY